MSSQRETWITIKNGNIVKHSENDGYALMKNGFNEHDEIIMSVQEAKEKKMYQDIIKQCEQSEFDWNKQLIKKNYYD
jgi:hypothetical protein